MLVFGCKTTQSTVSKSASKPVTPKKSASIYVLVDRGIKKNMNAFIKSQYNSLGLWAVRKLYIPVTSYSAEVQNLFLPKPMEQVPAGAGDAVKKN